MAVQPPPFNFATGFSDFEENWLKKFKLLSPPRFLGLVWSFPYLFINKFELDIEYQKYFEFDVQWSKCVYLGMYYFDIEFLIKSKDCYWVFPAPNYHYIKLWNCTIGWPLVCVYVSTIFRALYSVCMCKVVTTVSQSPSCPHGNLWAYTWMLVSRLVEQHFSS